MIQQTVNWGKLASTGPGAQILLDPGIEAQITRNTLQGNGWLRFAGVVGGLATFEAIPAKGDDCFAGPGWSIQLGGVAVPQIVRPQGTIPGRVTIDVNHALRWQGSLPPGPGTCSGLQIVHVSSLPK
jgi:hypothetical protein